MKKSRETLEYEIEKRLPDVEPKDLCRKLFAQNKIPVNISSNIISQQSKFTEYSEFILYCFAKQVTPQLINEYYTSKEIEFFNNYKYEMFKIKFPIEFDVKQVTDDQWIGRYSAKELMQLRSAGLINYNINTQRALTHIVKGEKDYYRITINKHNLKEIKNSIQERKFIPNTITLNINEDDPNASYIYKNDKLIVNSISSFDIIDGFHRYLAFGQIYDLDSNFDYPLEIRICNYSNSKGQQFTFQEDQKTPMKKIEAEGLNQYSLYNGICQRLNNDSLCNFQGLICNGGIINPGVFAWALKLYKVNNRKEMIEVAKEIRTKLNNLSELQPELLEKNWSNYHVCLVSYCFYNNIEPEIILKTINIMDKKISDKEKKSFSSYKTFSKSLRTIVEKFLSEVI